MKLSKRWCCAQRQECKYEGVMEAVHRDEGVKMVENLLG